MAITEEQRQAISSHLEIINHCEDSSNRKKALELILKSESITEEERVALHELHSSDGKSLLISAATLHLLQKDPELGIEIKQQAEMSLAELSEVEATQISEPTPEAVASYMSFVAAYLAVIIPAAEEGLMKGVASILIKDATYSAALIDGCAKAILASAGAVVGKYLIDQAGNKYAEIIAKSIKGFNEGLMGGGLVTAAVTSLVGGSAAAVAGKKSNIPDAVISATVALMVSGSIVEALYSGGEKYAYNKIYAVKDGKIQLKEQKLFEFVDSIFVAKKMSAGLRKSIESINFNELRDVIEDSGNAIISRFRMYYSPPARSSNLTERVMVTDAFSKISDLKTMHLNISAASNYFETLPNYQSRSIQVAKPITNIVITPSQDASGGAALVGALSLPFVRSLAKKLSAAKSK